MRLFLDDVRSAPEGWQEVRSAEAAILTLATRNVTHISLDHDLGEGKSGYDVVCWIERRAFEDDSYTPPEITVHSSNPPGRTRIQQAIDRIGKLLRMRDQIREREHEPNELTRRTLLDAEKEIGMEGSVSVEELFKELNN